MFFNTIEIGWGIDIKEHLGLGYTEVEAFEPIERGLAGVRLTPRQIFQQTGPGLTQTQQIIAPIFAGPDHGVGLFKFF